MYMSQISYFPFKPYAIIGLPIFAAAAAAAAKEEVSAL
jgi:hypothetical protein